MKTFKVFCQSGSLFDMETGKKIIFKENSELVISGDDHCFLDVDILNLEPSSIRNEKEMLDMVTKNYINKGNFALKMYSAGTVFNFNVAVTKSNQNRSKSYVFSCRILEDLYAYNPKNGGTPRLCSCQCVVDECLSMNIDYFNNVYAVSLNQAASKTITQYAPMQRSSSLNVLDEFNVFHYANDDEAKSCDYNLKKQVSYNMLFAERHAGNSFKL